MPTLWRGAEGDSAAAREHCYRISGLPWFSSLSIAALEAFSGAAAPPGQADCPTGFPDAWVSATTEGWLAGAQRSVRADYSSGACRVTVEGVGEFRVDPRRIDYPKPTATASPPVLVEALLGPALLLALAADARFALHASAAQVADRKLWLFLGDSGAGKSTLAASIGSNPGCRPVADDVLPVRWDGATLWALPWYPQLKLGDHGQYAGGGMPEHLPVSALCALASCHARDPVTIERLPLRGSDDGADPPHGFGATLLAGPAGPPPPRLRARGSVDTAVSAACAARSRVVSARFTGLCSRPKRPWCTRALQFERILLPVGSRSGPGTTRGCRLTASAPWMRSRTPALPGGSRNPATAGGWDCAAATASPRSDSPPMRPGAPASCCRDGWKITLSCCRSSVLGTAGRPERPTMSNCCWRSASATDRRRWAGSAVRWRRSSGNLDWHG